MNKRTKIDCCIGCVPPKRCAEPNCHTNCEEYLLQKAELDAGADERRKQAYTKHEIYRQRCIKVHEANRGKRYMV